MHPHISCWCLGLLAVSAAFVPGCALLSMNDPNANDKIRYQMAHLHAQRVLREAGSQLRPYTPDYDLMTFWRRDYDEQTTVIHDYQLYDFLKTSREPGPDRFEIAYDTATRETYLRTDLRSNQNVGTLPSSAPAAHEDSVRR